MIQSGNGLFQNITYKWDGKTVTLSQTITFPKAFKNPPVINLSIIGAWLEFTASGYSSKEGSTVSHLLESYQLTSTALSTKNFKINLEVLPIKFPPPVGGTTVTISGPLLKFSWLAYDEVTIGT